MKLRTFCEDPNYPKFWFFNCALQEKLVRLLQAIGFFAGQLGNRMYTSIGGVLEKSSDDDDDTEKQ